LPIVGNSALMLFSVPRDGNQGLENGSIESAERLSYFYGLWLVVSGHVCQPWISALMAAVI